MNELLHQISQEAPKLLAQYGCPGMSLAILSGSHTRYQTYGYEDVAQKKPVSESTIFQVCSISKAVSAWGVMRLVDDGLLDLDEPVDNYLSRWHLPYTEFDNRKVTVRRLLSHTAGLPVEGYTGVSKGKTMPPIEVILDGGMPPLDDYQHAYAIKWGFDPKTKHEPIRIVSEPGKRFSYSGGGYLLLDLLIEEISGEPVSDYLDKAVLAPLGMVNSTFHERGSDVAHYALPYDESGVVLPRYNYVHKTAGGLSADIRDLATFVRAEFAGASVEKSGLGVLSAKSFETMFEPVVFAESAGEIDFDIALGHFVGSLHGQELVQHSGGSTGWRSIYFALPKIDQGFAALINSSAGNEVWQALAAIWAGAIPLLDD